MISIIIPALNEESGIGKVIDSIPLKKLPGKTEIIVVDGDSQDITVKIAESRGARVIIEKRKGYGRAYRTGFEHAKGDIIVTLDADNTYPAEKIPELVNMLIKENLDFITTNRFASMEANAMTPRNIIGNKILTKIMNLLHSSNINDSQSGMWAFRKKLLDDLELTSDGMPFSEEIKIEAFRNGFKVKEVPIHYKIRTGTVKLCAWKDGFLNLGFLIKKKLTKRGK